MLDTLSGALDDNRIDYHPWKLLAGVRAVRDTFERNFARIAKAQPGIALIVGGERAIDLWARSRWNGRGIDVNAIAPGAFYLEMMDAMIKRTGEFADCSHANPWAARCNWGDPSLSGIPTR
jgi:hypothetical protein